MNIGEDKAADEESYAVQTCIHFRQYDSKDFAWKQERGVISEGYVYTFILWHGSFGSTSHLQRCRAHKLGETQRGVVGQS